MDALIRRKVKARNVEGAVDDQVRYTPQYFVFASQPLPEKTVLLLKRSKDGSCGECFR